LEEYAHKYNTVEIDQWFWSLFGEESIRLPRPADVQEYRQSVSDDFRFTVKVPNSITLTHQYKKAKSDPLVVNRLFLSRTLLNEFLGLLEPMRNLLGPLMLQFEYLNKKKMASQAQFQEAMADFAADLPEPYEFAVEIRNGNYVNEAFFEFLLESGLRPVLLQGYWMPPVAKVYEQYRSLIEQHDTVVVRLMGPDRKRIEAATGKQWNQIAEPKDDELAEIVGMVKSLLKQGVDVYLNINNHFEGSAPLTIERIQLLLDND
jgi:uncharacterized protein YecE (DUF72 family)